MEKKFAIDDIKATTISPHTAPITPDTTVPLGESGHHVPIISPISKKVWIMMIPIAIEFVKPNPTINPKLTAKDVAARDFRSILPLKYSAYTGRNPSLYTATFLFAKIDDMAPIPAANK